MGRCCGCRKKKCKCICVKKKKKCFSPCSSPCTPCSPCSLKLAASTWTPTLVVGSQAIIASVEHATFTKICQEIHANAALFLLFNTTILNPVVIQLQGLPCFPKGLGTVVANVSVLTALGIPFDQEIPIPVQGKLTLQVVPTPSIAEFVFDLGIFTFLPLYVRLNFMVDYTVSC